jgi:hypothetical protein
MGVFKQREIRASNGFQPEPPTNPVATCPPVAINLPNGIFRRFNRFFPRLRTVNPGHRGGR